MQKTKLIALVLMAMGSFSIAHAAEFDPLELWSGGGTTEVAKPKINQQKIDYSQYKFPSSNLPEDQLRIKIRQMGSKDKPVDPRSYNALKSYNPRADTSLDLAESGLSGRVLKQELSRLSRGFVSSGVKIPNGAAIKDGSQGNRVHLLGQGLANLGYLSGKTSYKYNNALKVALKQFQEDNGLTADGIAGQNTIDIINDDGNFRRKAIAYTLAQKPQTIPATGKVIVVNLASQRLRGYENGNLAITSAVIVGKEQYFTPEFRDTIDSITVNPTWNVPSGISKRSFQGKKVAVTAGPDNPLGKLRFNMYNPHTIYLHHTNHPNLFQRSRRTFSSGCIRVQKAYDLAAWLSGSKFNTFGGGFDSILAGNTQRTLTMSTPIPVYIEYRPAEILKSGKIQIWNDPYGRLKKATY